MSDHSGEHDGSALDGSGLVRAFERACARALGATRASAGEGSERERAEHVLEATAFVVGLEAIGRVGSITPADGVALASLARRTVLTASGLAVDEDDREGLELASRYAREGLRALSRSVVVTRDADEAPPPARDLVRFLRGELDGFASADLAMRLRGSPRGRAELATFVPSVPSAPRERLRVAADTLGATFEPVVRDPSEGRLVGTLTLAGSAIEAFLFDGVLALYAEPPKLLTVTSAGVVTRGLSAGYVELVVGDSEALGLRIECGDEVVDWALRLA